MAHFGAKVSDKERFQLTGERQTATSTCRAVVGASEVNDGRFRVTYVPDRELLTIFWQAPRQAQLCTELDDGVVLIKDEDSAEPIGVEVLSYRPDDLRVNSVTAEIGAT